jgi:aminoglycoside phosphotransferase family enzyme/predicted kinase
MTSKSKMELEQQDQLIHHLLHHPECLGCPAAKIEHIETHISHLLLADEYVFKIKKPLNLGFLNFKTVEKRRFYCEEELRLNQRTAPTLYLEVIEIGQNVKHPELNKAGEVLEYAVKMRRFRQEDLLNRQKLGHEMIEQLAMLIADFHQHAERSKDSAFGTPESIFKPMRDNFITIRALKQPLLRAERLIRLETWTEQQFKQWESLLEERHLAGQIRECHGDLHLGNITLFEGRITLFDGIEFNPALRWIDTLNDLAFLLMDLQYRGMNEAAAQLLNSYLERSGDYAGLPLLRLYLLYRAMVRAKVCAIRAFQSDIEHQEQKQQLEEYHQHIQLSELLIRHPPASMMLTHGVSGSGKSTISGWLSEHLMAIRLRSDVERKRLFPQPQDDEEGNTGFRYSAQATQITYQHLCAIAKYLLKSDYAVIIDATFLMRWQRALFLSMAKRLDVPLLILDCQAKEALLKERIARRQASSTDASEANLKVLAQQQALCEPLTADEHKCAIWIDSETFPPKGLIAMVLQHLMR